MSVSAAGCFWVSRASKVTAWYFFPSTRETSLIKSISYNPASGKKSYIFGSLNRRVRPLPTEASSALSSA